MLDFETVRQACWLLQSWHDSVKAVSGGITLISCLECAGKPLLNYAQARPVQIAHRATLLKSKHAG